ncbi:MAG: hypothetical protein KGL31_00670 [candidate division NC10 bacterium]|nr:hypothetical protein [candidate division NC10 bacterium]MDE2320425.1 hypothetical protein [candidate division NC10 bacterium]
MPLCLDCNLKHVQLITMQNEMLERQMNYLTDYMGMIVGLPGLGPRFPERKSVTIGGVTLNNIKIDRSTIGVVNTGSIETVDSAVTVLRHSGDPQLATAILELSQAVLNSSALIADTKAKIVDILSVLASEATAPKGRRRLAAIGPLLQEIATLVGGAAGLAEIWDRVRPILEAAF